MSRWGVLDELEKALARAAAVEAMEQERDRYDRRMDRFGLPHLDPKGLVAGWVSLQDVPTTPWTWGL